MDTDNKQVSTSSNKPISGRNLQFRKKFCEEHSTQEYSQELIKKLGIVAVLLLFRNKSLYYSYDTIRLKVHPSILQRTSANRAQEVANIGSIIRSDNFMFKSPKNVRPGLGIGALNSRNIKEIVFALECFHNKVASASCVDYALLDYLKKVVNRGKAFAKTVRTLPQPLTAGKFVEIVPQVILPSQLRLSTLLNPLCATLPVNVGFFKKP